MRRQIDLSAVVAALTATRYEHHTRPAPTEDDPHRTMIQTVAHPALLDLLENGLGTMGRGAGGASSGGSPGPIDAGALETWGQIRDQVRAWLKQLRAPWSDDLKADLKLWHEHWELAVFAGRVRGEYVDDVERTVESWQHRIEHKYDPDERREWTEACPAVLHEDAIAGVVQRCGARRILFNGSWQFAIALNVTQLVAECRACGARWDGERALMHLRYETNLAEMERALAEAAAAADVPVERRDLALTGPIDLP